MPNCISPGLRYLCNELCQQRVSQASAVAAQLAAMRERDPAAKALVFTQFSNTLAWLGVRLQQEGYGFRTISGSMPLKKRAQVFSFLSQYVPLAW